MAIPRDANYVPGSGRRSVRLSNGNIVPRATAENIYAQQTGWLSNYQRRQAFRHIDRSTKDYQKDREQARELGTSRQDFDNLRAHVQDDYARNKREMDKSPDGALAKYLEAIGRRDPSDRHYVGDSPSVQS